MRLLGKPEINRLIIATEENKMAADEGKISRNAPCPCGSGKKYKMCCGAKAVAEERLEEEMSSPFWTPEGVKAVPDNSGEPDGVKWVMEYELKEDAYVEDDADAVIEKLVRPFFKKFCGLQGPKGKGDQFEIAIVCSLMNDEGPLDSPSVTLCQYCQYWEVLRDELTSYFKIGVGTMCTCEVCFDMMYGGPIVSLTNDEDGLTYVYAVTKPKHYGEKEEE